MRSLRHMWAHRQQLGFNDGRVYSTSKSDDALPNTVALQIPANDDKVAVPWANKGCIIDRLCGSYEPKNCGCGET